jgi:hypothetical protein
MIFKDVTRRLPSIGATLPHKSESENKMSIPLSVTNFNISANGQTNLLSPGNFALSGIFMEVNNLASTAAGIAKYEGIIESLGSANQVLAILTGTAIPAAAGINNVGGAVDRTNIFLTFPDFLMCGRGNTIALFSTLTNLTALNVTIGLYGLVTP